MERERYALLDAYMRKCMRDADGAHDREHVYRVLGVALDIAVTEPDADKDVVIAACLLHDIGRRDQMRDKRLCHAAVGAEKAEKFLKKNGFGEEFAQRVAECVRTHRFRRGGAPQSIEAKILFDADKIDVCGATGIARTLLYQGHHGGALYAQSADGSLGRHGGEGRDVLWRIQAQTRKHRRAIVHRSRPGARRAKALRSAGLLPEHARGGALFPRRGKCAVAEVPVR